MKVKKEKNIIKGRMIIPIDREKDSHKALDNFQKVEKASEKIKHKRNESNVTYSENWKTFNYMEQYQ